MIDLKKFCYPEVGLYWNLQKPWLHGGFAHATNKHIYIRVPCIKYGKYPDGTLKNAHTSQKLFSEFVGTGVRIKACNLIRETQACSECKGACTLPDWNGSGGQSTCDWCMGTGVHFTPMLVRKRWGISSVYVEMCKWLPNCLIEADVKEGKPYKIYFDGGEGFVAAIDTKAPGHKRATA